ncbi:MAG: sensor histidine kinase [Caldicoprobacterales bacterium]
MKKAKRNNTLMKKLIKYFLVIIFSLVLISAYISYNFKSFYTSVYSMLSRAVDTYQIIMGVGDLYQKTENYVQSGVDNYLAEYKQNIQELYINLELLKQDSDGEEYQKIREIGNMIQSFDEKANQVFADYQQDVQPVFIYESISEMSRLKSYIEDDVKGILLNQLSNIMIYYGVFWEYIGNRENLVYILNALIIALCIFLAIRFSRHISQPIHQLAARLQRVAGGDLQADTIEIHTDDEINTVIESFNYMILKIKELIEEINTKAGIEKELHKQQIKNLEMSTLLNQSELKFLQSQINPHFLFNTMNSISALALIEGADETKKMIENLSAILKYNLKRGNEQVTLEDEYAIVESYLYIQRARFGNRIKFVLDIDKAVMDYPVPGMILQPLVENAIKHGLEPMEEEGLLELIIKDMCTDIVITIRDNGVGMSEERLRNIMANMNNCSSTNTSIGISNVIRRLELMFGRNVVDIRSTLGLGTEVYIMLPKNNLYCREKVQEGRRPL